MTRPADETQPPPQRRNRTAAIGGEAGLAGGGAFARMGFSDPSLVLRWREIAGPEVSRLCQPVRFADGAPSSNGKGGGTLTIKALPGAALFLSHETRALTERINTYLGRPAVARLKFVQGTFVPPRPAPPPRRPAAAKADDPAEAYYGPAALKEALQSLARWRQEFPKIELPNDLCQESAAKSSTAIGRQMT